MNIRIPFNPDLYVARPQAEAQVQDWLEGKDRLLTITSPPATGKSWFLWWIKREIDSSRNSPAFVLDIRPFLQSSEATPGTYVIAPAGQREWLEQFLREAHELCAQVPDFDPHVETAVLFEGFARATQRCEPNHKLYLLVEGSDDPTQDVWRTIERQLLEPIARIPNWRFVIVLRQEHRLYSYMLRRSERRLFLGASSTLISMDGHQQLQNLLNVETATDLPNVSQIVAVLPGYPWNHPGLNHFLYLEVKANCHLPQPEWLSEEYRQRGLCAITALSPTEIADIYPILQDIATKLAPEWSPEELSTHFRQSIKETWQRIDWLRGAWLVEQIPPNRFKISDGVREFVR